RACRNEGVVVARIYALACMSIMAAAIVNLAFCRPHRGARRTPSRRFYAPVADRWAERSDRPVLHFPVGGSGDGGLFQLRLADPVAGARFGRAAYPARPRLDDPCRYRPPQPGHQPRIPDTAT